MKTKSEIFTAAHKLAKTFEGNYNACFVLALEIVRNQKNNPFQTLAAFIISKMNDSSDWNEKFYTNKNNETNIYINGIQINVTTMFDACITKRYFVRSEFDSYFTPELEKMIDLELELI